MPLRTPEQHSKEVFADMSHPVSVTQGDTASLDAFGRSRVAEPEALFDGSFEYDLQPFLGSQVLTGNGAITHDTDARMAILSVGAGTGTASVQTLEYIPYQKGKSQRILATSVLGAPTAGVTKRIGYFDESDGVFVEQTGDGLFLVLRSSTSGSVVNTRISQANWNVDTFDGSKDAETNPSGIYLDQTKRQILDIDVEWLGTGRVRYGFNIDGRTYYAHYINNANAGDPRPYMRTGTLPVRYEISNDGSGLADTINVICAAAFSEGGFDLGRGIPFSANRGVVTASVGARVPVLSIRPKLTFNSFTNRGQIRPQTISVLTAAQNVLVEVVYDGLLFGTGSFVSVNDQSMVDYNVSYTAISGGYTLHSFYVATGAGGQNSRGNEASPITARLPLTLDAEGNNPIPLSIVCTPVTSTATVLASIDWYEVR